MAKKFNMADVLKKGHDFLKAKPLNEIFYSRKIVASRHNPKWCMNSKWR
jgi:hypothetical protein